MKKKIVFILPPIILVIVTLIWYFGEDGRWYYYRNELPFYPLFILHILMPVFYLVSFIVSVVRQIRRDTRSPSNLFYLITSAVLSIICFIGFVVFGIFTSGA